MAAAGHFLAFASEMDFACIQAFNSSKTTVL